MKIPKALFSLIYYSPVNTMIAMSKEEKTVLILFASALVAGTGLNYAVKEYPQCKNAVPLIGAHHAYRTVNVNTASYDDLVDLPYIGDYTATKILELRSQKGQIDSLDHIRAIKGIRQENFEIFSRYLSVR